MIETTVHVEGLSQLDQALRHLPLQFQRRVLRTGLRAAGTVIRRGMARRAPRSLVHRVRRGGRDYPQRLAASIRTRIRVRRGGDPTVEIGPSRRAFWGRFVELGTTHQAPQPFMVETLEQDGRLAVDAFAEGARAALEQLVRDVRSGAA